MSDAHIMTVAGQRASADIRELLLRVGRYLGHRRVKKQPEADDESAWRQFHAVYAHKIPAFAVKCGTAHGDIADCVQEVWRELMVRLPTFEFDPSRGGFDSWLFSIVQSKAVSVARSRQRRRRHESLLRLRTASARRRGPDGDVLEQREAMGKALEELSGRLSKLTYRVLQMRLVDEKPIREVAQSLGMSGAKVRYRYHRARRELAAIGSRIATSRAARGRTDNAECEKVMSVKKSAQQNGDGGVSPIILQDAIARSGGSSVDYVFQRLELGRRELNPEWKVEWKCEGTPRPVLLIRKLAMVAYAEICATSDLLDAHWPRIVTAAVTAGVAAGIATIITTPTAAMPAFRKEFYRQLQGKGGWEAEESIQVALSAQQDANGPWCQCDR